MRTKEAIRCAHRTPLKNWNLLRCLPRLLLRRDHAGRGERHGVTGAGRGRRRPRPPCPAPPSSRLAGWLAVSGDPGPRQRLRGGGVGEGAAARFT